MSENHNRGMEYSSKYKDMSTEELEEILRKDSEFQSGQELEAEELLYIIDVLSHRKGESHTGKTPQESWDYFEKNYLGSSANCRKNTSAHSHPWLRRLAAVAAVLILLISIPLATNAFSLEKTWNAVANWVKETFSFIESGQDVADPPSADIELSYSSLQEALNIGFSEPVQVPSAFPDGFHLTDIRIDEMPDRRTYIALYSNGSNMFMIRVQKYLSQDTEKMEINEPLEELYQTDTGDYYIFCNNGQLHAVWVDDSFECYISGELTVDEIKLMIDSIKKG